jgi:predicted amidohydrolase YtcJ
MSNDFSATIVVNARIATGDRRRPWADGAVIAGGEVVFVGSSAEAMKRRDATTRVIDAKGAELTPTDLPAFGT